MLILKMTKKYLPILLLINLLLVSCADFLEPIINNGELVIEAIIPTIGFARDVFVSDDYIYIAEDQAGFSIYNKANNSLVAHCYGDIEYARLIQVVEPVDLLFIYDYNGSPGRLVVYDITNITNPSETWPITSAGDRVVNKLFCEIQPNNSVNVYWTFGDKFRFGNYIINEPWLGSDGYAFPNAIKGFDIIDTLLFVTGEQRGLYITNRNDGTIISEVNTPGTAVDVKVHGNYAYIADKEYGISVIDISDITRPELIYNHDTSGYAQRIDAEGDYLAVASGGGGVYLFDISDRAQPEFADRWDDSDIGYTYDVDMRDGEVFVATREGVYRMLIIHDK